MYSAMRTQFLSLIIAALLFGILSTSCLQDADRDNPLDPGSKGFTNSGVLTGQTLTFYSPFQGLAGVEVRLEPGPLVARSSGNGEFRFDNVPSGEYMISASWPGYATDSMSVFVAVGENTQVVMNLDGLPVVKSFTVSSCHIRRSFPLSDLYLLEFQAQLDDPDGVNDVTFAEVQIPDIAFMDTLLIGQAPGFFSKRIPEMELPGASINATLGREIFIRARDRAGFQTVAGSVFLARLIFESPQTQSPTNQELLNEANPLLTWKAIELPFDFNYRLEVVGVDLGVNTTVWTQNDVANSETSIIVAEALTSGNYFWTVSVVDEFGNWSRSKEASFRIN